MLGKYSLTSYIICDGLLHKGKIIADNCQDSRNRRPNLNFIVSHRRMFPQYSVFVKKMAKEKDVFSKQL